jgi:hypothetical protein
MTTRIVLALVAFTAAVLVGAVVPLTLNATGHDRTNFVQATVATARTDAALAQARLDFMAQQQYSGETPSAAAGRANLAQWNPVITAIEDMRQSGDGLLILSNTLEAKAEVGMPQGDFTALAEEAVGRAQAEIKAGQTVQAVTENTGTRVIAAMPVFLQGEQSGPLVGVVIVARSTKSLESNIVALWVILGTISALAMIAAALLAFGLARWVSRPLKGLDAAARRLADGDLAIRTVVGSGPPELRRLGARRWPRCGCGLTCSPRTPPSRTPRPAGSSPRRSTSWRGCPGSSTACWRWRGPRTSCRCPSPWTSPRWPANGSWRGTRWPTTGASC